MDVPTPQPQEKESWGPVIGIIIILIILVLGGLYVFRNETNTQLPQEALRS